MPLAQSNANATSALDDIFKKDDSLESTYYDLKKTELDPLREIEIRVIQLAEPSSISPPLTIYQAFWSAF